MEFWGLYHYRRCLKYFYTQTMKEDKHNHERTWKIKSYQKSRHTNQKQESNVISKVNDQSTKMNKRGRIKNIKYSKQPKENGMPGTCTHLSIRTLNIKDTYWLSGLSHRSQSYPPARNSPHSKRHKL